MEIIIAIAGFLLSIALYVAGTRHGEKLERERVANERAIEHDRRLHELVSKVADEYVSMARSHYDSGPHALATLALHLLTSDTLIREAISEMHLRSGNDPWLGNSKSVEDVDLVKFFEYVTQTKVDFFSTPLEEVARKVKGLGGVRRHVAA
jgi:hypothetical protein